MKTTQDNAPTQNKTEADASVVEDAEVIEAVETINEEARKAGAVIHVSEAPTQMIPQSVHPGTMIQAMQQAENIDVDKMLALFDLQKQYDDELARKAYHRAKAEFAALAPTIFHDRDVDFNSTQYSYATLAGTMDQIKDALRQCKLHSSWKLGETERGEIKVTCYLTHELGYQEETSLSAARDAGKGATGMNSLQGAKSTVSYLERITLYALLGLASRYDDDDGQGEPEVIEYMTENDVANLRALFDEVGGDEAKFLQNFQTDSWETIPAMSRNRAFKLLEDKRAAANS